MEKQYIDLPNGEKLAYLETGTEHQDVLVLVHGNMSSSIHYLPVIADFAKDYRVIAMDLRGFGDSTYHTPINHLDDFADDVIAFINMKNIDTCDLVGWSTGGGIGLSLAARFPKRIKKLVLVESASYKGYPIYEKDATFQPVIGKQYQSKDAMAQDPVQVLPALKAMEDKNAAIMKDIWKAVIYNVNVPEEESLDVFINETLKQRNLVDVDWALMTFNMSHEHNGVTEGDGSIDLVKQPVLSIYGKKDLVIPEHMFKETVDALETVKTHIFENGSHSPITDHPDKLYSAIYHFITS